MGTRSWKKPTPSASTSFPELRHASAKRTFPVLNSYGSGALRPPPPVVAPLVPRCALLPAATPRLVGACPQPHACPAWGTRSGEDWRPSRHGTRSWETPSGGFDEAWLAVL